MKTILITNDDGVHSPGIAALKAALLPLGRVILVAPDRDNSAISHALTMSRPLKLTQLGDDHYCLDGTPADCVSISLNKILDRPPDLLVSGINSGPNIGDDISYSGTVSAAIEGTMYSVPSISVSLAGEPPLAFARTKLIIRELSIRVLSYGLPANTLMNVNIPGGDRFRGTLVTRQGRRLWKQPVKEVTDPRGRLHYWIGGGTPMLDGGKDTDVYAIGNDYVSVTPIHLDATNHEGINYFKDDLGLETMQANDIEPT